MKASIPELIEKSKWLRKELFEMIIRPKRGHIPSSYSAVEVVNSLFYGGVMNFDPKRPDWSERDRFIISKGHAAMVLYPVLADLGYYDTEAVPKFASKDALLRMYADPSIPGIEAVAGSLGHGLGIGAGYALSAKKDGQDYTSYVMLGDGECYEGSVWESAMFAAHYKLDNLVTIVDRNQLCIMGTTEECLSQGDLRAKFDAFGWDAQSIDGHSYEEIFAAIEKTKEKNGKPKAIIANTVKGKGISFMEKQPLWHNRMPNPEQTEKARAELENNPIVG